MQLVALDERYFFVYCINFLFNMLHSEMFLQRYSFVHFTIGTDVEVTFLHFRSIQTRVDVCVKVAEHEDYDNKAYWINLP